MAEDCNFLRSQLDELAQVVDELLIRDKKAAIENEEKGSGIDNSIVKSAQNPENTEWKTEHGDLLEMLESTASIFELRKKSYSPSIESPEDGFHCLNSSADPLDATETSRCMCYKCKPKILETTESRKCVCWKCRRNLKKLSSSNPQCSEYVAPKASLVENTSDNLPYNHSIKAKNAHSTHDYFREDGDGERLRHTFINKASDEELPANDMKSEECSSSVIETNSPRNDIYDEESESGDNDAQEDDDENEYYSSDSWSNIETKRESTQSKEEAPEEDNILGPVLRLRELMEKQREKIGLSEDQSISSSPSISRAVWHDTTVPGLIHYNDLKKATRLERASAYVKAYEEMQQYRSALSEWVLMRRRKPPSPILTNKYYSLVSVSKTTLSSQKSTSQELLPSSAIF
ncbi:uncharacterized protein VTP21DRAFT_11061 [Calcarisporiella thermophila]|uniref:uncharacterized protein n=1 Tax=Calcarisporiella thermophila TaxID=911321 RepID=UPI0037440FA2